MLHRDQMGLGRGWWLSLLGMAIVGCSQDYAVKAGQGELVVTPSLSDLGMVAVGATMEVTLDLAAPRGEVRILAVDVLNVEGNEFDFTAELPTVPAEGAETLVLQYQPSDVGLHYAQVTIVTDEGDENEHLVELRAEAIELDAHFSPSIVDFGPVDVDTTQTASVWFQNDSRMSLVIADMNMTGDGFATTESLPMTVGAGEMVELALTYSASDLEEQTGALSVNVGSWLTVDPVELRANACSTASGDLYDSDGDGYSFCATDCDDFDPAAHPGQTETCDGIDNDCDNTIDEGTPCFDDDGDGFTEEEGDCHDGNAAVHPDAPEQENNGIDDDCDGVVDAGEIDADGDGYTASAGDCDDSDGSSYPGAPEEPDDIDNDCDGTIDEGTVAYDDDGDGVTEKDGDCDDTDSSIYPSAPELGDFVDNDCDGTVDEGTDWYDDDGDGFTEIGGDCNDANSNISPGEPEVVGDGVDNNCDGVTR